MQRLAQLVKGRRVKLRLSKEKAAELAGMSPVTWTRVEDGLSVRELTYAGIETALGWPTRGITAYLADGDDAPLLADSGPVRSDPEPEGDRPTDLFALLDDFDDPIKVLRILREQLEDHGPDVFWATGRRIWRYHDAQPLSDGGSRQVG